MLFKKYNEIASFKKKRKSCHVTIWVNPKHIMLSEISQEQKEE